jgi:dissimilatory sulfite reductase (desulfoviridin) alpha/beta subunit
MDDQPRKPPVDLANLKSGGFIKETGKDRFTIRLRVPGGRMPVDRLRKIADVAERYGGDDPQVHLSVRQSVELLHVDFRHFDAVVAELGEAGQKVASCGARVRVPVACGGCEYNPNGLVDAQKAALLVDERLFGTDTEHHKFKVAFAGCPFDCLKSATNDVGFQGAAFPALDPDACIHCGLCAKNCDPGAIVMGEDRLPRFDPALCIWCGDCVKVCPSGAWSVEKRGYTVRIGGKWGRKPLVGTLFATFLPEGEVVAFLEEVLSWYREKAARLGRVRLGDVIRTEGTASLLDHLRKRFPGHVVGETRPPQVIDTQVGEGR